jgi:flagellar motor switch protein FliM
VNPRLERIETNSQFAQIISPSEMTAVITVNIKIGDVEGLINVVLPYITLDPIMDKLNTKFWYSNLQEKDDQSYNATVERLINKSAIPVKVVLGKTTVSVNDFASLRPGDIIRLDRKVDDELSIYVGDIMKFNGLPGTRGKQYAVRVTKVIREEKEENE